MEISVAPRAKHKACVLCGETSGRLKYVSMHLAGTSTAMVSGHETCVVEARSLLNRMPDNERREAERELLSRFW